MFDPVPWFVGGGAQHSPEVARLLAYAATSGAEGIVEIEDLRVQALDVPAGAVRVLPGAALILNRGVGGEQQTYVARMPTADQVDIAPTGSSGGRTDLIVAQIEDPFVSGEPWQEPTDPTVGPYVFTRVIPNVPAGTTRLQDVAGYSGRSAVVLARVTVPASTGTITNAMITDLRRLSRPRQARVVVNGEMPSSKEVTGSWADWPTAGVEVQIPDWAVDVSVRVECLGALIGSGSASGVNGEFRTYMGAQQIVTQRFNYNLTGISERVPVLVAGRGTIRVAAGESRVVKLQARQLGGTGELSTRADSYLVFDIQFYEVPIDQSGNPIAGGAY